MLSRLWWLPTDCGCSCPITSSGGEEAIGWLQPQSMSSHEGWPSTAPPSPPLPNAAARVKSGGGVILYMEKYNPPLFPTFFLS